MLSPALLRVCCLAVMAPALTKAVRQADGLGLLISPQKSIFVSLNTQAVDNNDRLSALSPAGVQKGDIVSTRRGVNGKSWQILPYYNIKSPEKPRKSPSHELPGVTQITDPNVLNNVKNDWCRFVGVLTPTAEHSDLENTMNEDISETQERMGLLNANTSLECDFRSKIDFSQRASPMCVDILPKEHEDADLSVKCPIGSLLSPPGSPKSISGESTSTVTAHNPSVVTFVELEEAKNIHRKNILRAKELLSRLRKLQIAQINRHTVSQLKSLVSHYQKVLSIPCQRSVRHNVVRRVKDSDLKAEFLQKEDGRNLSTAALVNLVRKYESSDASNKTVLPVKSPSTPIENILSNNKVHVRLNTDDFKQVKQVTGFLLTRVKHLESAVDSDVTESSSGGESCDELEGYDDTKLHSIPIHKRAVWTWVFERAPIAKRWTWLQSQVSDLEYRVRQIADLLAQARAAKSSLCFEETHPREPSNVEAISLKKTLRSVNGYLDHSSVISSNGYHQTAQSVPSSAEMLTDDSTNKLCNTQPTHFEDSGTVSRTRPIRPDVFRKRKLLRTTGLHLVSRKAARLSSVRCNCNTRGDIMPCILCSGRYNNTQSVDPCVMPLLERVALLQPTFHPLLSFEKDVALSFYFENHLKNSETYYHVRKPSPPQIRKPNIGLSPRSLGSSARNHSRKLTRHAAQTLLSSARYRNNRHGRSSSSKLRNHGLVFNKWRNFQKKPFKVKDRLRHWSAASSCSSRQDSPIHSPAVLDDGRDSFPDYKRRRDRNQYDIDNVLLPCNFRVLKRSPQYKEIITPKWRILEDNVSNGPIESGFESEEDLTEETISKSHAKLEIEERIRLSRGASQTGMSRRGRRNFHYESSGANTPDHVPSYQQDVFQDSNSMVSGGPSSPGISPPATPSSVHGMSDESQWGTGISNLTSRSERKRTVSFTKRERSVDESSRHQIQEDVVRLPPFEKRRFPLTDEEWQAIPPNFWTVNDAIISDEEKETESVPDDPISSPGSPETTSSTSSNVEDVTDPEWTVVNRHNGPERTLILKLAKR